MAISKRAKQRLKMASAAEKKQIKAAAKTLFYNELLGAARANDIMRYCEK